MTIKKPVFLALFLLALSSSALALRPAPEILANLQSQNPQFRREALLMLPTGMEARSTLERRDLLSGLVKSLEDPDRTVADFGGETLKKLLGEAVYASEGRREPSEYLLDVMSAVSAGLESFGARDRAEDALIGNIEAIANDSGRGSYLRLKILLAALARQNVSLGADSSIEEALEKVADIYGDAIDSSFTPDRERGAAGIIAAVTPFMEGVEEGNLWNRKRAEDFFEEIVERIEKALGSRNGRVRLDAAKLGKNLIEEAQKRRFSHRTDRLRKEIVESLEETLSDSSPEIRAESAESLGRLGDKSSVPALEKALKDKDKKVSEASAEAIRQITGKKPEVEKEKKGK